MENYQTGFPKCRSKGEHIGLIEGMIKYTETEGILGLILSLDLERVFSSQS